jgi:hypothetical protein
VYGGAARSLTLALVVVAVLGSCSSSTPTGTVTGTLRIAGGPYPGINNPTTGRVVLTPIGAASGKTRSVHVGASGHFTFRSHAGSYDLLGYPGFTGSQPCAVVTTIIRGKHTSHADVTCAIP